LTEVTIQITGSDWATPGGTIIGTVEQSLDGGLAWQHWVSCTFGTNDKHFQRTGLLPTCTVSDGLAIVRSVRASMVVSGRTITFGVDLTGV